MVVEGSRQTSAIPLDGVAVVGMTGRFPGAPNHDVLWANLCAGVESISRFDRDELDALVAPSHRDDPNYVPVRGIIENVEHFDARVFGYTPREAQIMDPQQRVFLEIAWSALEHAGYGPNTIAVPVGVYAGMGNNTYFRHHLAGRPDITSAAGDYPVMMGNEKDYIATRTSYKLNLTGPSVSIHTACSTSLVAICQAYHGLISFQCDMAVAGGVSIVLPQQSGYLYREDGIASHDGHCRPFDAAAQGCVFSNGGAAVVLKRLDDALNDRDTVYAVIRGVGMNNDGGDKVGFTAPGVAGQMGAIALAHASADVDPRSISYVEAHGTATAIGDPIEVAALTQAFRIKTPDCGFCAIGSVKGNLGHLDVAAGVTGFIKTALALHNKKIPPSINYHSPNPKIDFPSSPFYVVDKLTDWGADAGPRRAGVSGFGLGGTNAHVVLEEAPQVEPSRHVRAWHVLPLSANTADALDRVTDALGDVLAQPGDVQIGDISYTLGVGRQRFSHRRTIVCSNAREGADLIARRDRAQVISREDARLDTGVVFMFPGGGAQYANMAKGIYASEPMFRDQMALCRDRLLAVANIDLMDVLFEDTDRTLVDPRTALPALFAVEYSLARLWESWGLTPSAMIGHSMGEYAAAVLAGVFSLESALALVALRGRLFETLESGSMLGVAMEPSEVLQHLPADLDIAAVNSSRNCVVSGSVGAIDRWHQLLEDRGSESSKIHIAVAAHSRLVEPILSEFLTFLRSIEYGAPTIPFVSNVTGTWAEASVVMTPEYWCDHLRQTVRFADGVAAIRERVDAVWLEVGPGQTLGTFVRQQVSNPNDITIVSSLRHPRETTADDLFLQQNVAKLWLNGVNIRWESIFADADPRRVAVPTYPFERARHWVDAVAPKNHEPAAYQRNEVPPMLELHGQDNPEPQASVRGPAEGRQGRIVVELKDIIERMSGIEPQYLDEHATFLELGLDSLFLTQANAAFRKRFNVKITFRQLFDTAPTLHALATYIDELLPESDTVGGSTSQPGETGRDRGATKATLSHPFLGEITGSPGHQPNDVQRVIDQQLDIMRRQLEVLGGQVEPAVAMSRHPTLTANLPDHMSAASDEASLALSGEASVTGDLSKRFGPWRSVDARTNALTEHQEQAVKSLVDRYVRRTITSQQMTATQRQRLADPRAITGFRRGWKDMVYQIAVERSAGSKMWDVDGNEYVDLAMGFGINLFGYAPAFVTQAIEAQLAHGFEVGTLRMLGSDVAQLLCEITGAERATFVNTGSEAISAAVRAARTVTGRSRIAVFEGDYHGISDEMLVRPITVKGQRQSAPVAPGIPQHLVDGVIVLDYNDPNLFDVLEGYVDELAAIVVEPVQSRSPHFQPREILHRVRTVTEAHGIALIFDEMITGFRLHPRGAQAFYGIEADIIAYGKVLSGGLPMAAVAGKAEYLDAFDGGTWDYGDDSFPEADVTFFGGTFVRHPLSLAASKATLQHLKDCGPGLQRELNHRANELARTLNDILVAASAPIRVANCGSFFCLLFQDDNPLSRLIFYYLRLKGVHVWDRPFFLSTAHSDADIKCVVKAFGEAVEEMVAGEMWPVADAAERITSPSTFAMTPAQREIWLAAQLSDDASRSFHASVTVSFDGPFDSLAMQHSLTQMVDRHEALRTVFSETGDWQRVQPQTISPRLLDLESFDREERERHFQDLLHEDRLQLFDLANGPLVRFYIVRFGETDHRLVITAHHIVCDGWSIDMLIRDLSTLYSAAVRDVLPTVALPMAFQEYADWLTAETNGADRAETEQYWRGLFKTLPPVVDLPSDRPRPAVKQYGGGQRQITFDAKRLEALRAFCVKHQCTLFATTLAVFSAVLHRLTLANDVAIGVAVAGQASIGRSDLVGHCVNLLPFRSVVAPDQSFDAHLQRVRSDLFEAYEHQNFTYGSLLEHLSVPRDPSRLPLLAATITHETPTDGIAFVGVDAKLTSNPKAYTNFDLEAFLVESDDHLSIEFNYNLALFDAETVDHWLSAMDAAFENIVVDPNQPLSQLNLWSHEARERVLHSWNDTAHEVPCSSVHHLIEQQASHSPNAAAVSDGRVALTYRELEHRAQHVANHLSALGVGAGSVVGLYVDRSVDMVVAMLAVLKTGGAYLPLDPNFPDDRVGYMIDDADVTVVISDLPDASRFESDTMAIVHLHSITEQPAERPLAPVRTEGHHLAYVMYTSGSTGRPKGVEITHRSLVNLLKSMERVPGIDRHDVFLATTTLSFDIAMLEIFLPLVAGAKLIVAPTDVAEDGSQIAALIDSTGATIMQATPSRWRMVLDAGWSGSAGLRVLCGGEPLSPALATRLIERSAETWNMYGPTETTIWSTCCRLSNEAAVVPIGRPIANTQCYVLDEGLQPVLPGVPAELFIGGIGVAAGYHKHDQLTAERFIPNPFDASGQGRMYRTGDKVRYRSDGTLEFLGRLDSQVKIRGFRVELGEVESVVDLHEGIHRAVACVRELAPDDQRLVVYYTSEAKDPPSPASVKEHVRRALPEYMVPQHLVRVETIPMTPNGKVDRSALPSLIDERSADRSVFAAPTTPQEKALAVIWEDVLGTSNIGVDDSFFDLGGHSLTATRMISRVSREFGVTLPLRKVFETPTLAGLAKALNGSGEPKNHPIMTGGDVVEEFRI